MKKDVQNESIDGEVTRVVKCKETLRHIHFHLQNAVRMQY